jgi:chromosome segregation ATPase
MTLENRVGRVETDMDEIRALLGSAARHAENASAIAERNAIAITDQRQDAELVFQRLDRTDAQIQSNAVQIEAIGQRMDATNQRLDEYIIQNQRVLSNQGDRLARVEATLETLVNLSQSHERRLTGRESKLLEVEDRLDRIEANLEGLSGDVRSLTAAVDRLETVLERHLATHD